MASARRRSERCSVLPLSEWSREQLIAHLVLHGWVPFQHADDYNIAHATHWIHYVGCHYMRCGVEVFPRCLEDYTDAGDRAERLSMRWDNFPDDVIRMLVVALDEEGLL